MTVTRTMYWHEAPSPIGTLLLAGDGAHLKLVHFQSGPRPWRVAPAWICDAAPFGDVVRQFDEYFAGTRRVFDVPLAADGTAFQCAVWQALLCIPYGATVSYSDLARRIGRPQASRAVGLANGANPLPIIVPCHRVLGTDGSLTGFGGGLEMKRRLLAHELSTAAQGRDGQGQVDWLSPALNRRQAGRRTRS